MSIVEDIYRGKTSKILSNQALSGLEQSHVSLFKSPWGVLLVPVLPVTGEKLMSFSVL